MSRSPQPFSVNTHLASAAPAPSTTVGDAADPSRRVRRRRAQRLSMLGMVLASYGVDTLLLLALVGAGALAPVVPIAYAAAGLGCCALFYLLLGSGWSERAVDHYLVVPQMVVNALINLAFIVWAPQIGVLLMMVLFIVFAFGALRMSLGQVLFGAAALSLCVGGALALVGDRLALPMADALQRTICGLWFALVLARSTLLGLYGSQVRTLLAKRNAQLAASYEQLDALARRDELTGTLNRRSVMRLLADECQRADAGGRGCAVALLDIDHFKQVNDRHGHLVGDEVLRRFVMAAAAHMRGSDRMGRYGGEEFLMLLSATEDIAAAMAAAERVCQGVAQRDWSELLPDRALTVSAGVAVYRRGESIETLLARADEALYAAKDAGRNRVHAAGDLQPA